MKHYILVLKLLFIVNSTNCQISLEKVLTNSGAFYSHFQTGIIKISYSFKSSIAESSTTGTFTVSFCKQKKLLISTNDETQDIHTGKQYYMVNQAKKQYIDFSTDKGIKKASLKSLEQFPFYDPSILKRINPHKFNMELNGRFYHIFNFSTHYYFDTSNFSLIKFKDINISEYGIQIKEWDIKDQEVFNNCPNEMNNFSFLRTYEKVNTFASAEKNPNLKGQKLRSLLKDSSFILLADVYPDSLTGKFVLLDFFYQSCMPCIISFKYTKALYDNYAPKNIFVIVGIDPNMNDISSMEKFKRRYNLKHSVILGTQAEKINNFFNPTRGFPYYLLISPEGQIVEQCEGYDEKFFKKVEKIISEYKWQ